MFIYVIKSLLNFRVREVLTINVVYHFLVYFKFISCKAEANKVL